MDRRLFLAAAPLSAAAAAARPPGKPVTPVLDTHQHLWDLAALRLDWLKPGNPLYKSFTPADYAAATAGQGVTKSVYMEVDVTPADKQKEADFATELCLSGKTPTVAAVVGGRPADAGFPDYVKQFKGSKVVKGIRQVLQGPDFPAGFCLKPEFVRGVQRLGELGLTFDLCGPPAELTSFAKLVGLCPGTRFVLDHGGNPRVDFTPAQRDAWAAGLKAVAAHKHAVCKLSGFAVNGPPGSATAAGVKPYADAILDVFGAGRVMFGGDWPVVTRALPYAGWLDVVRGVLAARPAGESRAVLHDTAAAFYGL